MQTHFCWGACRRPRRHQAHHSHCCHTGCVGHSSTLTLSTMISTCAKYHTFSVTAGAFVYASMSIPVSVHLKDFVPIHLLTDAQICNRCVSSQCGRMPSRMLARVCVTELS